jgi:hypothetical protein
VKGEKNAFEADCGKKIAKNAPEIVCSLQLAVVAVRCAIVMTKKETERICE